MSLCVRLKSGEYRPATNDEIIAAAKVVLNRRFRRGTMLANPKDTIDYLTLKMGSLEHEMFSILWLDTRHRVIAFEELFRGTLDGASVPPREVVKEALSHNAAAAIFAHNHPSGVDEPSEADRRLTKRLKEALALIDVRVLDHVVIGDTYVSFAERGLL